MRRISTPRIFSKTATLPALHRAVPGVTLPQVPWNLTYWQIVLPKRIRDWNYAVIVAHRYRWFERRTPAVSRRQSSRPGFT